MAGLSPTYDRIKRLRSTGDCAAAVAMLRTGPPTSDEEAFEAVICLFICGDSDSALNVCRTYDWKKNWARQITAAFSERLTGGDASRALSLARQAVNAPETPYDGSAIFLLLLQENKLIEEARGYIEERLKNIPSGETFLLTVMAEAALSAGEWREAYRHACAVLSADPEDYRASIVLSVAAYEVGNIHESLGHAMRANAVRKGSAAAILQLMRGRNKLGNPYAALAAFDALADSGDISPELHVESGKAYQSTGDSERAIQEFRTALESGSPMIEALRGQLAIQVSARQTAELEAVVKTWSPKVDGDFLCVYWLGIDALNRGDLDGAARRFKQTQALAEASGNARSKLPWPIPEPRVRHDREQLELLEQRGRLNSSGRNALELLKRYSNEITDPETTIAPEETEAEALRHALCIPFYIPELPFAGRTLGENDYTAIEEKYLAERVVVIDDFLSQSALDALRQFCEEATVWKANYERGYLGAVLAEGLRPEVLLAIGTELRTTMPRVIGNHLLTQAWAFKYDQRLQGINMHADFAEINVNFWLTPDAACEDPASGGMVVYDVPVPENWTFHEYNNESEKLAVYLKVHKANALRVPYKANRCVLFDSSLIHVTDELHFKPGYTNRRVNVTLLYGKPRNID